MNLSHQIKQQHGLTNEFYPNHNWISLWIISWKQQCRSSDTVVISLSLFISLVEAITYKLINN
jgi:hypothetical protein